MNTEIVSDKSSHVAEVTTPRPHREGKGGGSASSLKSTIAVSLTNYLDAGAIVAGASGLTLWQNYLGLSEVHLGWLNFISANCLGAAIGAIIGGFLADRYGRKFIYTYNLLVYMTGVLIVMCSVNFPMLLLGFLVTDIHLREFRDLQSWTQHLHITDVMGIRTYDYPAVGYVLRTRRIPVRMG